MVLEPQVSNFYFFYFFFSHLNHNHGLTVRCSLDRVLQIGPSKFDAELLSRIMGPGHWFKNYVSLGQNYDFSFNNVVGSHS